MSPVRITDMWDERRPSKRKIKHQFMCPVLDAQGNMCGQIFKTIKSLHKHKTKNH